IRDDLVTGVQTCALRISTSRIETLRRLGAEAEGAVEVLRVYDVTFIDFTGDNAWASVDIEPTPGVESWYINVWKPAASYCAELRSGERRGGKERRSRWTA